MAIDTLGLATELTATASHPNSRSHTRGGQYDGSAECWDRSGNRRQIVLCQRANGISGSFHLRRYCESGWLNRIAWQSHEH